MSSTTTRSGASNSAFCGNRSLIVGLFLAGEKPHDYAWHNRVRRNMSHESSVSEMYPSGPGAQRVVELLAM
jgi:hypothetical protein